MSGYFANHLGVETQYMVNALVTNETWVPQLRTKFEAFAVLDGADHLQADFSSFWLAGTGSRSGSSYDIAVRPRVLPHAQRNLRACIS